MSEIALRPATLEDAQAITMCLSAAYAAPLRDLPDLPDVTDGVAEDIAAHTAWVASQNGDILGYIVFGRVDDAIMIFNLAVAPHAQGKGLAKRLLDLVEDAARTDGVETLVLRTHRKMTQTISLYLHLGWEQMMVRGNSVSLQKTLTKERPLS